MSDSPFFQFYPSDWLAGTRGLTASETGVYITLIAMMYEAEGPIPSDPKRLSRLCGSTPAAFQKSVDGLISTGKITLDERGFFNRRVEKEIEKRSEKRASASESAKVRWKKNKQKQCQDDASASDSQCVRNANQKPYREKEEADASSKKTGSRLSGDWRLPAAWGEWAMSEGMTETMTRQEADKFHDYWKGVPGSKGVKLDWQATWRNWVRKSVADSAAKARPNYRPGHPEIGEIREVGGVRKQYCGNGTGWLVIHD